MRLLYDVYSGAGGCTRGYQEADFRVIGVDINPQPHYVGEGFIQMDALEFLCRYEQGEFERAVAIHASPPCLKFQKLNRAKQAEHPNLITPTRSALMSIGLPYVIENVMDARPWMSPESITLCGSMFGLGVWRHRLFDVPWLDLPLLPTCNHSQSPVLVSGVTRKKGAHRRENSAAECREATGIDWMTRKELDQAIPPAYTKFIGERLQEFLNWKEDQI